ncbi:MAG: cyclic pyranopterin monophosphate synthase MoaC [Chloroflexota bacterium]|nr:cyclic pyranopterin monophosphate synthase MoaC [Chloroflexota bacterium]
MEPTRMVDVSQKPATAREAQARGVVRMKPETLSMIRGAKTPKGDVLATAQVAGFMAAKQTSSLIPMCHPLMLDEVKVTFEFLDDAVEVAASVKCTGKTGVEMEALTTVAVAALTIYDMCKAVDPGMKLDAIRLVRKSGGKSGTVVLE